MLGFTPTVGGTSQCSDDEVEEEEDDPEEPGEKGCCFKESQSQWTFGLGAGGGLCIVQHRGEAEAEAEKMVGAREAAADDGAEAAEMWEGEWMALLGGESLSVGDHAVGELHIRGRRRRAVSVCGGGG
jgi:hypothetical protein